ncbi:MAG: hypothetical protein DRN20_02070 [Thermoplasmata archaeon]|nr:MAG: hypothetical protein DRN20_02070 [Thermoplasmata archaeon]
MKKNYYLSSSEQKVYNVVSHAELVTLELVRELFPELSMGMLYKVLSSLEKKGYLYRLRRGLYLVRKRPGEMAVIENPYRVALSLYKGYIGFSSALRHYNLIEYDFHCFRGHCGEIRQYAGGKHTAHPLSHRRRT